MARAHSFFIPDEKYCFDKAGLLQYLEEKVYLDFVCVQCNNKGIGEFQSA